MSVNTSNCETNLIVQRGKDWKSGNQDHQNGNPARGVIAVCEGVAEKGWTSVKWLSLIHI